MIYSHKILNICTLTRKQHYNFPMFSFSSMIISGVCVPGGLLLTDSAHHSPCYSCSSSPLLPSTGPPSCAAHPPLSPVPLEYRPHTCCRVTHTHTHKHTLYHTHGISHTALMLLVCVLLTPPVSLLSGLPVPLPQHASVPASLLGSEPPADPAAVRLSEAHHAAARLIR